MSLSPLDTQNHDATEAQNSVLDQIGGEVVSWARCILQMPTVALPDADIPGSAWPAFFPLEVKRDGRLNDFEALTCRAIQSVLVREPSRLDRVQVSAWSKRPFQGGYEPMRLALNWDTRCEVSPPYLTMLKVHIHNLVFGPQTVWGMDDFAALSLHPGPPGSGYSFSRELFTRLVQAPASNHERLRLINEFHAPPAGTPQ